MRKNYAVYSLKLMRYLDSQGIKFIGARPNLDDPDKVVFYYENTPALDKTIKEYQDYQNN